MTQQKIAFLTEEKEADGGFSPWRTVIDGKIARLTEDLECLFSFLHLRVTLSLIYFKTDNQASLRHLALREICKEVPVRLQENPLAEDISLRQVLSLINGLNASHEVHGIAVDLPLPAHIPPRPVLDAVAPVKDVRVNLNNLELYQSEPVKDLFLAVMLLENTVEAAFQQLPRLRRRNR